jgi:hypothetical protein
MSCLSAVAASLVLSFPGLQGPAPAEATAQAFLTWKGRPWTLAEAAAELPEVVRAELAIWEPWCLAHGYRALLDDDAVAIVVASAKRRDLARLAERCAAVTRALDALVPRPARDPGETFLAPSWGVGQHVPESGPATVAVLEQEPHFDAALELMVALKPFLADRLPREESPATFHSGEGRSGALLAEPEGIELGTVWRPENEVVNRLARLLLHRRFGSLPYWLEMGLAWNVEQEIVGDLYSFPGRDEFVSVADHAGWKNELKRMFSKRRKEPLRLEELSGWSSHRWDADAAAIAWGFGRFLATQDPAAVSSALEELRLDVKQGSVRTLPDGRWELVVGYATPLERQGEILARHLGDDVLARASEAFRAGRL